jgi:malic enzyme
MRLRDQCVVAVGAGSAGCGISAQLCAAMVLEGLPETEARARFWLLGRRGLLHGGLSNLTPEQQRWVQPDERLASWRREGGVGIGNFRIAQCNNSYIFPGMGLGILAAGARRVTDEMFMAAAQALADCSPARVDSSAALLPALENIRQVLRQIALALGAKAQQQGLAANQPAELERLVDANCWWEPHYPRLRSKGRRME